MWRRQNYSREQDQFLSKKHCAFFTTAAKKEERCSRGSDDFFGVGAA